MILKDFFVDFRFQRFFVMVFLEGEQSCVAWAISKKGNGTGNGTGNGMGNGMGSGN